MFKTLKSFPKTFAAAIAVMALIILPPLWCAEPCARCHPRETAGFEASPMGRSLGPPQPEPSGTFVHTTSNTKFHIDSSRAGITQTLERNGFSTQYKMAYAIGSGTHAVGYLVQLGNHLFQSPIAYYAGYGWGMAPGYEGEQAPDFDMSIGAQCLFCHAGEARPVRGAFYNYQEPVFAAEQITCARCHGPAEAHLRNPVAGSIINPANLPARSRDSVCEQCHLAGEAFILNPGKEFGDFRPGQNLEEVFSVYVFKASRDPAHPDALTVVSQAGQLALSKCARMSSGKLWCGTCHDPHAQRGRADSAAYYRSRCLACHGDALPKTHPRPNDNCAGCHMPTLPVTNGGHTIFTDHRIAIYTAQEIAGKAAPASAQPAVEAGDLEAWRAPAPALEERNLGLADVFAGERLHRLALVNQGLELLLRSQQQYPNDAEIESAIGAVRLGQGDAADAATRFEKVIQMTPNDAPSYVLAALAWHALHNQAKAIERLNQALELDPLVHQPYRNLAQIYSEQNNAAMVRQTYQRFLKAFPESVEAQSDVARTVRLMARPVAGGGGAGAH